jgi:hypothetical protein
MTMTICSISETAAAQLPTIAGRILAQHGATIFAVDRSVLVAGLVEFAFQGGQIVAQLHRHMGSGGSTATWARAAPPPHGLGRPDHGRVLAQVDLRAVLALIPPAAGGAAVLSRR